MEEDGQTSKGEESRLTLIINPGNRVKDDGTRGKGKSRRELVECEDWRVVRVKAWLWSN